MLNYNYLENKLLGFFKNFISSQFLINKLFKKIKIILLMNSFPLEISQYKLGSLIGRGATSEVYSAVCLKNKRRLAIKVVNLETCPIEIDNLRAEVSFWANCKHPNVVEYYGSFVDKSYLYILMEYMSGGSCYEIMRFNHPKGIGNETIIATILREVLKSLAYFHENRQLHRDVKAGNILINDRGEVKIADFGIAANLVEQGQRKRARFTVIGTPCYMAPEILAAGIGYTEKADIWSLGITAIELATGSAPYANLYPLEVIVRISNSPPPTLPENQNFSGAFRDFVRQCLQQVASKRASAHQLLETKFIKQATSTSDIARNLIATLPPLEERFLKVHQNSDTQQQAQQQKASEKQEAKVEKVEWIFNDTDSTTQNEEESKSENNKNQNKLLVSKSSSNFSKNSSFPVRSTSNPSMNQSNDSNIKRPTTIQAAASTEQLIQPNLTIGDKENTKVVKKGKFTITQRKTLPTDADDQKIQMMESEVATLKHRIQSISSQNEGIKNQIQILENELRELTADDD